MDGPRDASWEFAERYDADYFGAAFGEPYSRDTPMWVEFFGRVADFIVAELAPRTVLDAGCAIGLLVEALRERGVDARGFDVSAYAISQVPAPLKPYCLVGSVTDQIDGAFDLVTCIEVLEHVPRESAERALDNLTGCTDRVLFSSTPDDDNEPTHVNLRPPDQWVKEFATRGFFPRTTKAGLVIAPQAIVFERGTPELSEALGQSELARVELVRQLWDVRREAGSRDARVRELEGQMQSQRSTNEELRATIGILRQGVAEAERGLEELRATTWWRVGRPVRGAITLVVTHFPAIRGMTRTGSRPAAGPRHSLVAIVKRVLPGPARRALVARYPQLVERLVTTPEVATSVEDIAAKRLPLLRPLSVFPVPNDGKRHLTMMTDSLSAGSLFGGVGTSIILAAALARRLDASLRVVTRTERPQSTNFSTVLQAHGVEWDANVEFAYMPLEPGSAALAYRAGEVFLTTSWWSTWSALRSVDPKRIVYLLQEDERRFYPAGDEQLACSEVLSDSRIRFAVNTSMLRDYLVGEGFDSIAQHGISFEPAFPERIFHQEEGAQARPRRFFFYARPNNPRNLFLLGLEAVNAAIEQGLLEPDEWEVHFVGSGGIPPIALSRGVVPMIHENLPWPEYAALIRRIDVGLSLMSTPHPSYPPLDLAACGAVAVTNKSGPKQDLDAYSRNIICVEPSRNAIVEGIRAALDLAGDDVRRTENYESQGLSRSWTDSLAAVVDDLARTL